MKSPSLLDNISIVLVGARTPANIGAAARCMMNMGLSRLMLVAPRKDYGSEAHKLAAGADAILSGAVIASSLAEAVADHGLVVGTSRHPGRLRKNVRTPREMAQQTAPLLSANRIAVVFGNEVNGLDRRELALCHEFIAIPSSEVFPSLNLSHAVMIVAYEFFLATHGSVATGTGDTVLARTEDLERFYDHLQDALIENGFLHEGQTERMMFGIRQLFGRARLTPDDVRILRGMLSAGKRTRKGRK
jgi:TrmH family RNA methyltransferase